MHVTNQGLFMMSYTLSDKHT